MSAKKTKATPPDVLAAQGALQRAEHARLSAQLSARLSAQHELERARFEAAQALQDARVRADGHLPRAESCTMNWIERRPIRRAAVIVRRTAATITTRFPGEADEQQWRKDKAGKWRQWPDRGSSYWLELPEGQK